MGRLEFKRGVWRARGQDHTDALRSFHDVSVSKDVAVRIDDDAGANGMLPGDSRCGVFMILQGAVPSDHYLDNCW